MEVSNMLVEGLAPGAPRFARPAESDPPSRLYNTRHMEPEYAMLPSGGDVTMNEIYPSTETGLAHQSLSPTKTSQPKHVSFELLLPESPQHRARLPMRVNIYPHDTTDSIITTVKNFYGLYERRGVVFEDRNGNTLIARYENFIHDMVVYVRVTAEEPELDELSPGPRQSLSPRRPRLDDAFQMLPPALNYHQTSKLDFRNTSRQSQSPQPGRGRRSGSASTNAKSRTRPAPKSRGTSSHGSFADVNGDGNYSDSDGGNASVTSSRRGKKEQVASAEISVDNIVEGGRRKRAKFDSSELPLFVPPQVPMTASLSSVSPQRRISSQNGASPYSLSTNQQTFAFSHPLQSPQSYGHTDVAYLQGLATPYSTSSGQFQGFRSRTRGSAQYAPYRQSATGGAILPTPDPTLGSASVISDEDVARQLMRLGDASNFSTQGRTSTSTVDDALSGKADAASSSEESDEGSDDEDNGLPPLPFSAVHPNGANGQLARAFDSGDTSGEDYEDNDDSFKGESDEIVPEELQGQGLLTNGVRARSSFSAKSSKSGKPRAHSKSKGKTGTSTKQPMSPSSLPTQSRKASSASLNFQHQLGVDEEDLSSKPRCQRCRKSKKGCDRQRPCQRCKDAGIGVEGCVSEDEGNGRKGRYGRHMGVPVKKSQMEPPTFHDIPVGAVAYSAGHSSTLEKSKKRKR
ncbi:hypothetical protein K491DRAFT_592561 [Lophiostoma macrostomum CBS 122681]|uniref:Zn(2)-C6 fungal-type domain-containing protein n=1 Tax=Lophiostoma macrostomum CBS 122681 TaxID=1314788 RepID=A0A6A6TJ04_9PLEO|nr:hypothetical protein K491DRAFT_592561 [Lophiostoma macrostomum CBS 122681]